MAINFEPNLPKPQETPSSSENHSKEIIPELNYAHNALEWITYQRPAENPLTVGEARRNLLRFELGNTSIGSGQKIDVASLEKHAVFSYLLTLREHNDPRYDQWIKFFQPPIAQPSI